MGGWRWSQNNGGQVCPRALKTHGAPYAGLLHIWDPNLALLNQFTQTPSSGSLFGWLVCWLVPSVSEYDIVSQVRALLHPKCLSLKEEVVIRIAKS